MSEPTPHPPVDLAARRALAGKIRAIFPPSSSGPIVDPAWLDFAELLTKWESGGIYGRHPSPEPINPNRPTDQYHG